MEYKFASTEELHEFLNEELLIAAKASSFYIALKNGVQYEDLSFNL